MYLDCRHLNKDDFTAHFPTIYEKCNSIGIDPMKDMIPVVPACHYMCGGILVDEHGRSSIHRLYAAGECSSTGLHGANRLASNSLSECAVFGARAARKALDEPATTPAGPPPAPQPITIPARSTQEAMWRDAGLVRDREGLERLLDDPHPLARLVARCALLREETRGSHIRRDFPETNPDLDLHHAVVQDDEPTFHVWR
jgi:L-aspartate oxidase